LQPWLQEVIQVVEPWMSSDIQKGDRWATELSERLERSRFGIICLTARSLISPWIYFEAGALAKTKDATVCCLLIDLSANKIEYPLAQFQNATTEENDVRKLVHSINGAVSRVGKPGLKESVLERVFDRNWPALRNELDKISSSRFADELEPFENEPLEMFGEVIGVVLSSSPAPGLRIEELTTKVFQTLSPQQPLPQAPMALALFATEIENKHVQKLMRRGLVEIKGSFYSLTEEGRRYFSQARERLKNLFAKFQAVQVTK
jgi:hypothetical protein